MLSELMLLLGARLTDRRVAAFCGSLDPSVSPTTAGYYVHYSFRRHGVGLAFTDPLLRSNPLEVPETCLSAVHLHGMGHERYDEFSAGLPIGLRFGETIDAVEAGLGPPFERGGGQMSRVLRRVIEPWAKYPLGEFVVHLQFGSRGLELVTMMQRDR